jgi:hypothetical protein
MRTYIIGNDGIALCRKVPATVSDGEIVVASKEELQAAPLSGKRLLASWNALPGVEKRRKVGDRATLIVFCYWSHGSASSDCHRRRTACLRASSAGECVCQSGARRYWRRAAQTTEQQAVLTLHRSREILVKQQTMLANLNSRLPRRFGIVAPLGIRRVSELIAVIKDDADQRIHANHRFLRL